jgi:hypothetical protein
LEQRRHYQHRGEGSRRQQQQQQQNRQRQKQQQQLEATGDGYIPIEQILSKVSSGEEVKKLRIKVEKLSFFTKREFEVNN